MKRYIRLILLVVIIAAIGAIAWGLNYAYTMYSVDRILVTVQGARPTLAGLENYYGQNIILVNQSTLEQDLKNRNPSIRSVKVTKVYPSTIKLVVSTRRPMAQIEVSDGGVFILDRDGTIMTKSKTRDASLPMITYYQSFQYNQYQTGNLLDFHDIVVTLALIDGVTGFGYAPQHVDIDGQNVIRLLLTGNRSFVMTTEKDRDVELYQLKQLLRQFKIEGRDFKTIDLRFDKPVMTTK